MEFTRPLPTDIDVVLCRGGTILTGNQRAARTLRLDFDRQRRSEGLASWQPPAIFAWDTWLAKLWHQALMEGHADRLLLNRTQELQLWRSIISADTGAQWSSLQSIDSLATVASDAWQKLCGYRGQQRLGALGVSGDTRAFQRWAQAFTRRCKSDLYLSSSELEFSIASILSAGDLRCPSNELLLIGFDIFTPARELLLDVLRDAGVSVTHQALQPSASKLHLVSAIDLDDELVQAALWLRQTLEADPETRVAVIHPDIATERAEVDRVFRHILAPELNDITANPASSPYEFSLGHPLSQQPMVALAIKLLRWTISPVSIDDVSLILLSPYFASRISQDHHRAEFDAFELRQIRPLRPEFDLPVFIKHIERIKHAGRWKTLLNQLNGLQREATTHLSGNRQRSFANWADNVREILQAAAWARPAPDSSLEFQVRRKWESVLDELATLDFEGTRATFLQALDQLERIAQRTLFAPESREAPVQIMGPQEAAGSRFDALYFLRASDLQWPRRPGIDPLLGWRLQRDLQMPGINAAHDAEHGHRITTRLAASATTVIFSYAQQTADAHQRPSPALAALPLTTLQALQPSPPAIPLDLETIEDPGDIPLVNPRVQGGSSILKLQAACGFRAFAEKRLGSTTPEIREPGMDARERGNVVHEALENLWQDLRTQANLRSLPSEQRSAALARAIDLSLAKFTRAAASAWDAAYLELQRERLHRLLSAWLEVELARLPFEVKLREQEYEDAAIGPLLLSLRVDRIDRVFTADGEELGEVILDYKTGLAKPSDWQTDRPDEPQLPLYAALRQPGTVAGMAFATLRPGKDMALSGLATHENILPKVAKLTFETLDVQIAEWHRILTSLATDFAEGDARVRPKSYPTTCEFCQQRILCRLDPTTLEDLIDEADEADA